MQPFSTHHLNGFFNQLPADIRNLIFSSYFNGKMIGNLIRSHKLAIPERVWEEIFKKENGGYSPSFVFSWKKTYADFALILRNIRTQNFGRIDPQMHSVFFYQNKWVTCDKDALVFHAPDNRKTKIPVSQQKLYSNSILMLGYNRFCTTDGYFENDWLRLEEEQSLTIWEDLKPIYSVNQEGSYQFFKDSFAEVNFRTLTVRNYKTGFTSPPIEMQGHNPCLHIGEHTVAVAFEFDGIRTHDRVTGKLISETKFTGNFKWDFLIRRLPLQVCQEHIIIKDDNPDILAYPIHNLKQHFVIPHVANRFTIEGNYFYGTSRKDNLIHKIDLFLKKSVKHYLLPAEEQTKDLHASGNRLWVITQSYSAYVYDTMNAHWINSIKLRDQGAKDPLIHFSSPFVYAIYDDHVNFYNLGTGNFSGKMKIKSSFISRFESYDGLIVDKQHDTRIYSLYQPLPRHLFDKVINTASRVLKPSKKSCEKA